MYIRSFTYSKLRLKPYIASHCYIQVMCQKYVHIEMAYSGEQSEQLVNMICF